MRCIADSAPGPTGAPDPADRRASAVALRGFRAPDVPFVAAIVADALHEHYDAGLYLSLSAEWPEGFLVATDGRDVPVAFLLGVSQVPREARILMFAVDRPWRAQGVGRLLMSTFLERCRDRGYHRVTLEVRVSNATAIPLLQPIRLLRRRPPPGILLRRGERLPDGPALP
ncbi:GCN5-related N-acetyltransferase domain protein [mine drainage metagenome]|uniref:GCN5-related N-acetyltransferase domain protein n=1 Tax=mine drainage metagenome TaxID=410659 RepID=T1AI52_9ZZZZ